MRNGLVGLAVTVMLAPCWTAAQAQAVPLTAGYYEVTISGLPGGSSEDRPRCLTPGHLSNPEGAFTYAYQPTYTPNPANKVLNFSVAGGRIRYDVETAASRIHVEGTLTSTTFAVDRTAKSKSGAGAPLSMKLQGRRTGECKP